jgi:predicted nuclease of restriction endonuclease-like (RecB) superfamily
MTPAALDSDYKATVSGISEVLEQARRSAARSVNRIMAAAYWEIGRRIVVHEQRGMRRAGYGEEVLKRFAADLTAKHGRGFSRQNLQQMRAFFLAWEICQTASGKFVARAYGPSLQALSGPPPQHPRATSSPKRDLSKLMGAFPLSWSCYVELLSVDNLVARAFYEAEAHRAGWTVRQLGRQIASQFYERTALSRNKAAMLKKGDKARPLDELTPEQEIKDPFFLEFLDLKDEYSELDLEEALICHLESFLLELGNDFTFVARQRRLRIDDEWFRVDLVFFHRGLQCLVLIDLKLDKLTAGDIGQMNLYLNYARDHWTRPEENRPVGLILCAKRGHGVAKYALTGMTNKILASQYRTALPPEGVLAGELDRTRALLETPPRRLVGRIRQRRNKKKGR